jgi:hypothetical protein
VLSGFLLPFVLFGHQTPLCPHWSVLQGNWSRKFIGEGEAIPWIECALATPSSPNGADGVRCDLTLVPQEGRAADGQTQNWDSHCSQVLYRWSQHEACLLPPESQPRN